MSRKSSEMPPRGALTWPSSHLPTPNGITGTRAAPHSRTTCCTSSVVCGNTTASGGWFAIHVTVLPCCSRTACEVTRRLPNWAASAAMTPSTALRSRFCSVFASANAIMFSRVCLQSSLVPKIAAPQLGGNVGFVPNADQNAAPRRLAAPIVDLLFRARGALRYAKAPSGQRRRQPLAFAGMGRIGAEVVQFVGIVQAIEQHRPEADGMDQLPELIGDHEPASVARL